MAGRHIVFENGSNAILKFSYRYGYTASKIEHLETLVPGASFTYKVRDDGTYEKIVVEYRSSSEGSEVFKATSLKINADTMKKYSTIRVVDPASSSDEVVRRFSLETVDREPASSWFASTLNKFCNQDIPR